MRHAENVNVIHSTAIIHSKAELGNNVTIGPYCVVDADVTIGDNCKLESHVVIKGKTTIGKDNHFYQFGSIGEDCQDKKYKGELTELRIGDGNIFREGVTAHRGTVQDKGITQVGSHNLIMTNAHIAHDCVIGDNSILATLCTLAGHVTVGDWVILGGMTAIHQFCHIGSHSFVGGGVIVLRDVPPYVMLGEGSIPRGINSEGLRRRGYSAEAIMQIKRAYKVIYRNGNRAEEAVALLREMAKETPEVLVMADFIDNSARGIAR